MAEISFEAKEELIATLIVTRRCVLQRVCIGSLSSEIKPGEEIRLGCSFRGRPTSFPVRILSVHEYGGGSIYSDLELELSGEPITYDKK